MPNEAKLFDSNLCNIVRWMAVGVIYVVCFAATNRWLNLVYMYAYIHCQSMSCLHWFKLVSCLLYIFLEGFRSIYILNQIGAERLLFYQYSIFFVLESFQIKNRADALFTNWISRYIQQVQIESEIINYTKNHEIFYLQE